MRALLSLVITLLLITAVVRIAHLSERDYCVRELGKRYPTASAGQLELACAGLGR